MIVTEIKKEFRVEVPMTEKQYIKWSTSDFDFDSFGWRDSWPDCEYSGGVVYFAIMDDEREAERLDQIIFELLEEETIKTFTFLVTVAGEVQEFSANGETKDHARDWVLTMYQDVCVSRGIEAEDPPNITLCFVDE
jgi:hypothetical protein